MMSGIGFSVPSPVSEFLPQQSSQIYHFANSSNLNPNPIPDNNFSLPKKKRNFPGKPDPNAEVIALSPKSLMATNRFICEICNKGFQRDQNLQLHRRGHNLPWKLKQRSSSSSNKLDENQVKIKKVYICPEKSCVHHEPNRALGDLTGIKKHFSRKHGEKKWKCDKCSKKYAVQSDWKAHSKTCGTREYKCDCGTLFSRKDSFITHRAFCDALVDESSRLIANRDSNAKSNFNGNSFNQLTFNHDPNSQGRIFVQSDHNNFNHFKNNSFIPINNNLFEISNRVPCSNGNNSSKLASSCLGGGGMSATALLLKAAQLGSTKSSPSCSGSSVGVMSSFRPSKGVRDFLGTNSMMKMVKFGSSEQMGLSQFVPND